LNLRLFPGKNGAHANARSESTGTPEADPLIAGETVARRTGISPPGPALHGPLTPAAPDVAHKPRPDGDAVVARLVNSTGSNKTRLEGSGIVMETPTQTALVLATQAGDQKAFETLVGAYQRELLVHCYRMLGLLSDAEDLVQETLLRAWEKRATLSSPQSYRTWLYRIATNLCLNRLMRAPQRFVLSKTHPSGDPGSPAPPQRREPIWLEPFSDDLLADPGDDPENRALRRERISLAFLITLLHLTPVQRAILLLREVLEWPAVEVAEWLNLSVSAVNSALQRARRA
jgi:RNA polymerase sigma factor (sigma-70 family)